MDRDIYENRAEMIGAALTELLDELSITGRGTDDERKRRNEILREIQALSQIEKDTAEILLDDTENYLKEKELKTLEADRKERLSLDRDELSLKRELEESELVHRDKISANELAVERERLTVEQAKTEAERDRVAVERMKVDAMYEATGADERMQAEKSRTDKFSAKARVFGEGLGTLGTIIGVVGTLVALGAAIRFEKMDSGGIVPSKFLSMIFRMSSK